MSDQVLERFHRALIEEIQTQRPDYLTAPFTVAEIYQNLVPYGSHRDRIGVEMNGDYEDALIRLLAGEGGYLILDSEPALRDLRAELETPHPNTGLYREFAAVDVRLNQAYLDLAASAMDSLPDLVEELEADDPVAMTELAPSAGGGALGIVPPGVDIFSDEPESAAGATPDVTPAGTAAPTSRGAGEDSTEAPVIRPPLAPEFVDDDPPAPAPAAPEGPPTPTSSPATPSSAGQCRWCSEALPARDGLNFCPFCGTDLKIVPCWSCGSELEAGWRFCASCGAEAPA
jgi:hypothetical protein